MRQWLFENNRDLSPVAYGTYVRDAGLDTATFLTDFTSKRHAPEIEEDIAHATAAGITGTPSFVLGTTNGKTIHGERIVGAKSFPILKRKIDALLATNRGTELEKLTP